MDETPKAVTPSTDKRADLLKIGAPVVLGMCIGLIVGMKVARFLNPPKLPAARQPCAECAQRKAAEAEAMIQAQRRDAALLLHRDAEPPDNGMVDRQLHVENPKTFSPAGPASAE